MAVTVWLSEAYRQALVAEWYRQIGMNRESEAVGTSPWIDLVSGKIVADLSKMNEHLAKWVKFGPIQEIKMRVGWKTILKAMKREARYQDDKWGETYHDISGWLLIMEGELKEAKRAWRKLPGSAATDGALREILQVMTVGARCLQQHGIVERDQPYPLTEKEEC